MNGRGGFAHIRDAPPTIAPHASVSTTANPIGVSCMHPYARPALIAACALATGVFVLQAQAQFAKPEDAIKYRRAVMTVMATHFGRVAGMANGKIPFDPKAAADSADVALTMSKLPFVAFIPGT